MSFIQEIENIEDHRVDANKDYELADIIFLTIAAVLCGAKGWKAIKITKSKSRLMPWDVKP